MAINRPKYTNSQIRELIRERIHSRSDRKILFLKLVDGLTFGEIAEETGIEGKILAPLGSIDYWFTVSGHRVHKTVHHYLLQATGGELTIENDPDKEAVDVAWVPIHELARKLSFPNERRIADLAKEVLPEHR